MNKATEKSVEDLRKEFVKIQKESGLPAKEFASLARIALKRTKITNPSPQDWLNAAKTVSKIRVLSNDKPLANVEVKTTPTPLMLTPSTKKEEVVEKVVEEVVEEVKEVVEKVEKVEAKEENDKAFEALNFKNTSNKILKMVPSMYICVGTEVISFNRRRTLSREKKTDEKLQEAYNTDVIVVKTVSEQTIINPKEKEKAEDLRQKIRNKLIRLGTVINGNLLSIPLEKVEEWKKIRTEVYEEAKQFEKTATHYRILIMAYILEIAVGETELVARRLTYDIQQILEDMRKSLEDLDTKRVSQLASELKAKMVNVAESSQKEALKEAISVAREEASKIRKLVKEKTETIETVKEKVNTTSINNTRLMFLDYALPEEVDEVIVPVSSSRFSNLETE